MTATGKQNCAPRAATWSGEKCLGQCRPGILCRQRHRHRHQAAVLVTDATIRERIQALWRDWTLDADAAA